MSLPNTLRLFDESLPTLEENLALDEALLVSHVAGELATDVLRLWEWPEPAVVVGRGTRVNEEVHREVCERRGIPILRRASGGGAVVLGPGCLVYSLILNREARPELADAAGIHCHILSRITSALCALVSGIRPRGTSDLAQDSRKFSGNSLRIMREAVLYHGTLLYAFPLGLMEEVLRHPPRQPDYRKDRTHIDFVANLPVTRDQLRECLIDEFDAREPLVEWSRELVESFVRERYGRRDWHLDR